MFDVVNLSLAGAPALGPVSLSLPHGGCWWLTGPSGSGKSLLLECLAGMHAEAFGSVCIDGRNVASLSPERRSVTLMLQRWRLFPHWDVAGNLRFAARFGNASWSRVEDLGERLQVRRLFGRSVTTLSGGETQRLSLLQTLLAPSRVLLLDEPLSAVDRSLQSLILDLLVQEIDESRRICLMAAHSAFSGYPLQGSLSMEAGKLVLSPR